MIKKLLTPSTVQLQVEANDWQEAGMRAGDLLLQNQFIEHDYIQRMIDVVHEYGPYIVIAPQIALFHARPEESVKEICLSMVTLKEPVEFGAGENDPVDLVFALGALDHDSHIEAMAHLTRILQDQELVHQIRTGNDKAHIINMIYKKVDEKEVNNAL